MNEPRKKKRTGRSGRPRIAGPSVTVPASTSQSSLPPIVVGDRLGSSSPSLRYHTPEETKIPCPACQHLTKKWTCEQCGGKVKQPTWRIPDDSVIREHAMRIIALRLGGMEDPEIAAYLKLSPNSISAYVHRASRNGWLSSFNSAKETIEYGLTHKVLRNLDEALDDDTRPMSGGFKNKTAVALKIAEGTIFKSFAEAENAPSQQTAISIRIEQPREVVPMRPGTIGGLIDVEVSGVLPE